MPKTNRREVLAMTAAGAAATALPIVPVAAQGAPATQAPGFYRMRVGDLVVTAITEGVAARPLEGFVRNADIADVRRAAQAAFLPAETFVNPFTSLVIEHGANLTLLDTGLGEFGPPTASGWLANFRAAGYDPARVTRILISHFHGDHIGGIRNRDGQLRFPNAEIHVPTLEWAHWMSDERMNAAPEAARGGFMNARRVFAPIAANVKRFEPGGELAPGVTSVAAYGHAPGHTAYVIASGNARLMFVADLASNPAIFARHPDWSTIFDMDADMARASRRRILDMAASERLQLSFYHAPFPATGFVAREGNGFAWVPASWTTQL